MQAERDWAGAVARAHALADADPQAAVLLTRSTWDGRAVRGLIAMALMVTARDLRADPRQVPLRPAMGLLAETGRLRAAVALHLHDEDHGALAEWAWLTRTWDPLDPPGRRWDGLPRGIARGSTAPALEVCANPWALNILERADQP